MTLSAIIHTKNAEKTLVQALTSVAFADEVLVIDMESSDQTVALARKMKATVLKHPDVGYADPARNFGLKHAQYDWILVLDADEEVTAPLKKFVLEVVNGQVTEELQADAYYLPRKNIIFDQWLEHTGWWPDYQLRLFKKGTVKWQDGVHRLPDVEGRSLKLPASETYAILHHNYQAVDQFIDRLNRYTSIKADEVTSTKSQPPALTAHQVVNSFGNEFFSRLFANQGLKDGVHGLSLSLLQAMYELTVQLKVWQKAGFNPRNSEAETIKALTSFEHDLSYWLADWRVQHTTGLTKIWWQLRRKYHW